MTLVELHPRRNAAVRAAAQAEIDLETIMAPRGQYDELVILGACARLKHSPDWIVSERAKAVEAAVISYALSELPDRRRIRIRHVVWAAGIAVVGLLMWQSWINFWVVTGGLV